MIEKCLDFKALNLAFEALPRCVVRLREMGSVVQTATSGKSRRLFSKNTSGSTNPDLCIFPPQKQYMYTRSLGAVRAPTSRLRPFGPALGPSGLLDNVLHALRALRPCDPRNSAMMG